MTSEKPIQLARHTFPAITQNLSPLGSLLGAIVFATVAATGCGGDAPPSMTDDSLAPPPAGQGLQYSMTSSIAAGQEIERCQFFVAPPEGYYVNHDLVRYTRGSHHVLLYLTPYKTVPTLDFRGGTHDVSGVFDCAEGATADWQVTGVLSGAQSTSADSMVNLPPDVGIKVPGGAVLLMNTHYLNASPDPLETTSRINLYTMPAEQVKTEGGVILFYNPFIRVLGNDQASARMRCPVPSDITLSTIQSHMHRRGVGYSANWLDEKGVLIENLYENSDWQTVPVKVWDGGKHLSAGTTIDYHCDYRNDEDRTVYQGFSTKDEMCVLLGSYYPLTPGFDNCSQPTYVGSGGKNGADTMTCLQAASGDQHVMDGCIVDSCPAIGGALTRALGCQFSQGGGACQTICASDASQCQACIQQTCQPLLDAAAQAQCG